jgi:hypothetical protein
MADRCSSSAIAVAAELDAAGAALSASATVDGDGEGAGVAAIGAAGGDSGVFVAAQAVTSAIASIHPRPLGLSMNRDYFAAASRAKAG